IRILDWAKAKDLRSFEVSREFHHDASWAPGNQTLAVAGSKYITVWNVANGKEVSRIDNQYHHGTALALSADGKLLAIATDESTLRQATRLQLVLSASAEKQWESKGWFHVFGAVALSPNGKYLVSATTPGRQKGPPVQLWDCATGKPILEMKGNL